MRCGTVAMLTQQQRSAIVSCMAVAGVSACGNALSVAVRGTAHKSTPPEDAETVVVVDAEEDPVEVLRRVQRENAAKAAILRDKAPPAPAKHAGKTMFFDTHEAKEQEAAAAPQPPTATSHMKTAAASAPRPVGKVVPRPQATTASARPSGPLAGKKTTASATAARAEGSAATPFMATLEKMDTESKSTSFPTYDAAAEKRRRHIDEKIKEERKNLLVFRDVGMDLDKPILSRDVFLVFKYFRYGTEFAVDNELERQLRYFNEHAVNELKIIQDSKLMRGPPTLSRKRHASSGVKRSVFSAPSGVGSSPRSGGSGGTATVAVSTAGGGVVSPDSQVSNLTSSNPSSSAPFQITSSFPHVRCANLLQYCTSFENQRRATLQSLLRPSASQSTFAQYLVGKDGHATVSAPPKFDASSEAQMTTLSPASFRRPAVVIYSQMGQKFGTECDAAWRTLAYSTICPALVPYLTSASPAGPSSTPASSTTASHRSSPIDVISLRSADLYKYRWVHALYVRRLAKTLAVTANAKSDDNTASSDGVRKLLTAATTFVGPRLLEPFYATLGLRNYLLPQVMLVDHEGVVRWLSGGLPDAYEAEHFPALLKQLETEYYGARRAS